MIAVVLNLLVPMIILSQVNTLFVQQATTLNRKIGKLYVSIVFMGSFSRSAGSYNTGSRTAVSNMVMSVTVMITLLLLTPLFYCTPGVVLASIIVTVVLDLIDLLSTYFLWKVNKVNFLACLGAFFGDIFISVQFGLVIVVGILVFKILLHVMRPYTLLLGNIPGTNYFTNVEQYDQATRIPAFLILRIEAPMYFVNFTYLRESVITKIKGISTFGFNFVQGTKSIDLIKK